MDDRQTARLDKREPWGEPAIVLERSLEVAAQGNGPSDALNPPQGFLGPLGTSGNRGTCF